MQVDFDEVGLAGISIEAGGAFDVDAEDDWQFIQQTAVDGEVAFVGIEVAEIELRDGKFQLILIACGEHEFASLFLRIGVAAEERAEISLEAWRELVEGNFAPELGGGNKDEQVFLPALAGGVEGGFAKAVDE